MEAIKETATNFLKGTLKQMETADKAALFTASGKYTNARRNCGDVKPAYDNFVNVIKQMEQKYGFELLALDLDQAKIIDEVAEKIEIATNIVAGGKKYFCSFNNLDDANVWLANQKNIEIKSMMVETTGAGLNVSNIRFDYIVHQKEMNMGYRVCEDRKTRFFVASNPKKFRAKWEEKNPQFKYVTSIKRKWGFSLIGGSVGFFRLIKENYIVLYAFKNN
jgi:hypothetical protein